MNHDEYWHSLLEQLAALPSIYLVKGVGTLSFFSLAILYYLIVGRQVSGGRLTKTFAQVFRRDLYQDRSTYIDTWNSVLFGITSPLTGFVASLIIGPDFQGLLIHWFGKRTPVFDHFLTVILQSVGLYLSFEFAGYWWHRLEHKWPILWSLHRPHHSSEALTFFTTFRGHPLEVIAAAFLYAPVNGFLSGLLLYALGTGLQPAAIETFGITGVLLHMWNCFNHSHLRISLGWLDYIVSTPVMHQIHHSAEVRHRDTNFGFTFMFWDWLFGTIYVPKGNEEYRWGLNDDELGDCNPHNRLLEFYREPIRHAWKATSRLVMSGRRGLTDGYPS